MMNFLGGARAALADFARIGPPEPRQAPPPPAASRDPELPASIARAHLPETLSECARIDRAVTIFDALGGAEIEAATRATRERDLAFYAEHVRRFPRVDPMLPPPPPPVPAAILAYLKATAALAAQMPPPPKLPIVDFTE